MQLRSMTTLILTSAVSFLAACSGNEGGAEPTTNTPAHAAEGGQTIADSTVTGKPPAPATTGLATVTPAPSASSTTAATTATAAPTAAPAPTWTQVYALLSARCADCHGDTDPTAGLAFGSQKAGYDSMVNQNASIGPCASSPHVVVKPGDAASSLLSQKLAGTQTCGSAMPKGHNVVPFTATELALVDGWIAAGAKND